MKIGIVGRGSGIITTFCPDPDENEYLALQKSASIIRNALDELKEAFT